MSTEIVRANQAAPATVQPGAGALSLAAMSPRDAWLFCESLADTPLLPDAYRNRPASVLWAMEYGRALGLDVVTTITTIHVIKGKPTQSADLMLSRTRAAGHKVRIRQEPGQCTVSIWRADDPDFENVITWTYDDAVTAGLCEIRNGRPYARSQKGEPQAWEKFPRAMLRARAISECVRTTCPEVLHGAIYTPEELGARVDSEGLPMEAEVQQLRSVPASEPDPWATPAPQVEAAPQGAIPPEQQAANDAATFTNPGAIRELYREAKDAGLLAATVKTPQGSMELGAYLVARGQELAKTATPTGSSENPAGRVVTGAVLSAQEQAEAAEQELRQFAEQVGLPTIDADFEAAKGLPLTEATADQIRGFLTELRGTAA